MLQQQDSVLDSPHADDAGIGPADHLRELGIEVALDLPGVGENLQDHLEIYLQMECTQPVSLYKHYNLLGKALVPINDALEGKNGLRQDIRICRDDGTVLAAELFCNSHVTGLGKVSRVFGGLKVQTVMEPV